MGKRLSIRRIVLDVDKPISRPNLIEIAKAIDSVTGVQGLNITVTEIETVGTGVTIEGENLDVDALVRAIESARAFVHSID